MIGSHEGRIGLVAVIDVDEVSVRAVAEGLESHGPVLPIVADCSISESASPLASSKDSMSALLTSASTGSLHSAWTASNTDSNGRKESWDWKSLV